MFEPQQLFFFITFLPQFIPAGTKGPLPFLLLGQLFILCSLPWCLTLVYLASSAAGLLRNSPQSQQVIHGVSGLAFIGMGTAIALQG